MFPNKFPTCTHIQNLNMSVCHIKTFYPIRHAFHYKIHFSLDEYMDTGFKLNRV